MARKKTKKKIWAYKLKHPEASNREIAIATKRLCLRLKLMIGRYAEGSVREGFVSLKQYPKNAAPPSSATRADILEDALSK